MSATFATLKVLIKSNRVRVSQHAFKRLAQHAVSIDDLVASIDGAEMLEDYPSYHIGPALLALHTYAQMPIHAVWGIEKGTNEPAVLVTTYRPEPALWSADFKTRVKP